jgi:dipeptidase E
MRLYLSSYGLGNKPDELLRLVRSNSRVAVIMNAGDLDSEYRKVSLEKQISSLEALGFKSEEIDLRKYFGKSDDLKKRLSGFGAIWIRGGNVFVLQRAVEQSGFNKVIVEMLKNDQIVYAGYSAGAIITTPTLHGIELIDNPSEIPEGYKKDFSWEGMSLVSYSIAPHYQSDHPESKAIEKLVQYFEDKKMPYKKLRDGEVVVVEGEKERII